MIPDFLILGHATVDLLDTGHPLGGTATYAAITAQRLEMRVGMVTAVGPQINLQEALPSIEISIHPSFQTTTFQNIYAPQGRIQYIHSIADPIPYWAVPQDWRQAPLVLLGPVVHEFDEALIAIFPNAFVGIAPQGWLRTWDQTGRVQPRMWPRAAATIPRVGVVIVSEEDLLGEAAALMPILEKAPLAIITRGENGATLYERGHRLDLPPRPAQVVDPTGAGDVFAAAFMVKYSHTGNALLSVQFAQVAASFSTEAPGTTGIPDRAKVEDWLRYHAADLGLG